MGELFVLAMISICTVLVISWVWKAFCWVWLKPTKLQRHFRKQGIKGPPYRLLFGNMKENVSMTKEAQSKPMDFSHDIVPRVCPFIHQMAQKYGKWCLIWLGPTLTVQVMDPDLVRDVLSNKSGHFTKTVPFPLFKFLGSGITYYEGEKWARHRKIINPIFHGEKLKMLLPVFYTCCTEMVSKWQKVVTGESGELDVWPEFKNLTGEVISRIAFGSSYKESRRLSQIQLEQAELVIQASQSPYVPGFSYYVPTKRNRRMKENYREVRAVLRGIINKRDKARKNGKANTNDLLGMLLESNFKEIQEDDKNVRMSIDDIIEECRLFYFVGGETVTTLLTWTMIVLSMHPEWQTQAREEVLQFFGKGKHDFDGLNHLNIITMILNEVHRLYPPGVFYIRTTKTTTKLGKVCIPPGVSITMPILLIHHDHELWGDDAQEFNPTRFADGTSKFIKNHAPYFPFGWGPRICLGETFAMIEAKMALAMILKNFWFGLSPTYVHAPYSVVTIQPQHGAQLILHKL